MHHCNAGACKIDLRFHCPYTSVQCVHACGHACVTYNIAVCVACSDHVGGRLCMYAMHVRNACMGE